MSDQFLSLESNLMSSDDLRIIEGDLNPGIIDAVQGDEHVFSSEPIEMKIEDENNYWSRNIYVDSNLGIADPLPPPIYSEMQAVTVPVPQIPANQDYAGQLDFNIEITPFTANRNSWIFSSPLNKVFINIQNVLPVDVRHNPVDINLNVRATMLYSLPQYTQELVQRCNMHGDVNHSSNKGIPLLTIKNVLRCSNPNTIYCGDFDRGEHLSVVTALERPQPGTNSVRLNYQFMCKNSCPSGMNRRAVDVIFTLENDSGFVLGRRKLSVRICSCPKRDKEKEEKEYHDSLNAMQQLSHGKKRKITCAVSRPKAENKDDCLYDIQMSVVGKERMRAVLQFARNLHAADAQFEGADEEAKLRLKKIADELNASLKKCSE